MRINPIVGLWAFGGVIVLAVVITTFNAQVAEQERCRSTKELVEKTANLFDQDEEFFSKLEPPLKDAWDRPLKCGVEKGAISECQVISAGSDGVFGTKDDIVGVNRNFHTAKAGEKVGTETGRFGSGFIKGIGKSLKEQFWDKKEE